MFQRAASLLILLVLPLALFACIKPAGSGDDGGNRSAAGPSDGGPATLPIPGESTSSPDTDMQGAPADTGSGMVQLTQGNSVSYGDPFYPDAKPQADSRIIDLPAFMFGEEVPRRIPSYPAEWITTDPFDKVSEHFRGKYMGVDPNFFRWSFISVDPEQGKPAIVQIWYDWTDNDDVQHADYYLIKIHQVEGGCEIAIEKQR